MDLIDFVENAAVGLHQVGADGTILWANASELRMLGYARSEYIGHDIREFHADADVIARILTRLSARETLHNCEARLRAKDGSVKVVLISSNALFEGGQFKHTRCFTRDITELKQVELELRESKRTLEVLLDISRAFAEAGFDLDRIYEAVTHRVAEHLQDSCFLRLFTEDGVNAQILAPWHVDPVGAAVQAMYRGSIQPASEGTTAPVLLEGRPVRLEGLEIRPSLPFHSPYREYLERFPTRCVLAVPVRAAGVLLGALVSSRTRADKPYSEADERMLQEVADRAGMAISSARQQQALEREREQLRVERQRMQAVIEQMPSALAITDAAGRTIIANDQNEQIFRLKVPATTGVEDYGSYRGLHPDGAEIKPQEWPLSRSLSTGEVVKGEEIHIVRGDGTHGFIRVNSAPVRDAENKIVAGVVTFDDISDEKRAVEELRRSQQQMQHLTDALPALIFIITPDLRYRFANRACEEWFGTPPEELIGRKLDEVLPGAAMTELRPKLAAALAGEVTRFESTVPNARGGLREVRIDYIPQRGPAGTVESLVALVTDFTEQKHAEHRSRFLARASAVLASSLDYETTLKAVAQLAVPDLADWCGVEMKLPDGTTEQVAVVHTDPAKVALAAELRRRYPPLPSATIGVPQVLRTGKPELYSELTDAMIVRTARDPDHLRLSRALGLGSLITVPITTSQGTVGAITMVSSAPGRFTEADLPFLEDLGGRIGLAIENARLYSEAKAAVLKRDDFLSVASHELKTPLTSLDLQVEVLLRASRTDAGIQPGTLVEKLRRVEAQSDRLRDLVDTLLDVSRISAGRLELACEPTDLSHLAREVAARFQEQAARAGVKLVVEAPAEGVLGEWDPNRLDQVLTNLLSNGIKYGHGKPVVLTITGGASGGRITVRDQGIGISPKDQARLFRRFERAASSRNYGGMGLGLWISKQIVEAHGGTLSLSSDLAAGATFTVELPPRIAP